MYVEVTLSHSITVVGAVFYKEEGTRVYGGPVHTCINTWCSESRVSQPYIYYYHYYYCQHHIACWTAVNALERGMKGDSQPRQNKKQKKKKKKLSECRDCRCPVRNYSGVLSAQCTTLAYSHWCIAHASHKTTVVELWPQLATMTNYVHFEVRSAHSPEYHIWFTCTLYACAI